MYLDHTGRRQALLESIRDGFVVGFVTSEACITGDRILVRVRPQAVPYRVNGENGNANIRISLLAADDR